MRHKKLKFSALLLLGFGLSGLQAQTSINATGGNASGSVGSLSYSIGQISYQTSTGTSGSVAEGVQQAYKISEVTGIEGTEGIDLLLSAYPNPVTDNLILTVDNYEISSLNFQLFDMQGKLLQNEKLTSAETQINMFKYAPSTYFVRVINGNQSIKEFKIIKN